MATDHNSCFVCFIEFIKIVFKFNKIKVLDFRASTLPAPCIQKTLPATKGATPMDNSKATFFASFGFIRLPVLLNA